MFGETVALGFQNTTVQMGHSASLGKHGLGAVHGVVIRQQVRQGRSTLRRVDR